MFHDGVTADKRSMMNSEVYIVMLFDQIQSNAAKLLKRCFVVQMDNEPKHTV